MKNDDVETRVEIMRTNLSDLTMLKSSGNSSNCSNNNNNMDTVTLILQHAWRVAFIIGCLSLSIQTAISFSINTTFGLISILSAVLCLYWLKEEVSLCLHRRKLPPGELGLPVVGEAFRFFRNPPGYAMEKRQKYGDIYTEKTTLAPFSMSIVMGNEQGIAWLWNAERKGQAQGSWPPSIQQLLGKGAVANASGKRHRMLRRLLEPAFTPNATRDYVHVLDTTTLECLATWSSSTSPAAVVMFQSSSEFKIFALRLFFMAAFGRVDETLMHQLHDDFCLWINGFGSLVPLRCIPGTRFAIAMDARDRILATVESLIQQFRKENPPTSERAQKSMMGRVCYGTNDEGKPIDLEDLKDNVLNMIFAGHDTTYASMGTALHYLAQHPDIYNAVTKEVESFQEPLDFDELKNAPLLNAFLAEMWRMDPPVNAAFRKLTKNTEYNGYSFQRDMIVRYDINSSLQNEVLYPYPSQFEIARFLPVDHPLSLSSPSSGVNDNRPFNKSCWHAKGVDYNNMQANYAVFGGGSHGCLGSHFAKLEMRVLITRLLQKYNLMVRNSEKVWFPVNGWKNEFALEAK